ncbi:MAG: hypothetical protein Q9170_001361 [Blastenia crenularia]
MNSASEERWRTTRGPQRSSDQHQNPNYFRQSNQQRQLSSGGGGGPLQRGSHSSTQESTAMSGNAWVNNNRSNREAQHGPPQEHTPVNGFDAQDARDALKKGSFPNQVTPQDPDLIC